MANNQLKEEIILQTGQFDRNINNVIRKVEELKNKGNKIGGGFNSSMGKMIERATGFNGSLGSLVGTVGKLGGALGLITTGVNIADWFKNAVEQGTRLATEAEGVRIAFERLNKGDLLENLRKETHGTVSDIELMKQAVKFNDFNLPMEEMGTFLAFAQQKAKDTGESIDYMVNSIVTGLGRKSLPILDNLGLSAAEIKERMKEGGDMTTAVANIIRDRMQAAGGYVETAGDRAKRKEVELENALTELGRTFQPLKETSSDFFHSIEIGAINAINSLKPLINQFTELGRVMNNFEALGGDNKVNRMLGNLKGGDGKLKNNAYTIYQQQVNKIDEYINKKQTQKASYRGGKDSIEKSYIAKIDEEIKAAEKLRAAYVKGANDLYRSSTAKTKTETTETATTKTSTSKKNVEISYVEGSVGYYEKLISELEKEIKLQVDSSEIDKLQDKIREAESNIKQLMNPIKIEPIDVSKLNLNISSSLLTDLDKVQIPIKTLPQMYKESEEKIRNVFEALDMGLIGEDKAKELIDGINKNLSSFGLKPIKVNFETDSEKLFAEIEDKAGSILYGFEGIDGVVDNITSLSEAIYNGANAWETFIGVLETGMSIIQAVSDVIKTVNTLTELFGTTQLVAAEQTAAAAATEVAASTSVTAAKSGEAIAGATASGSKLPFPFNLAAIAAGIAAVVGALSMIGAFANGGIVGGNSYAGDGLIARVNSGEMILNGSQQKNLFNLLDKGNTSGVANGGNVHFVIRGQDLHGVLNNYDNKMKKVR